MCYIDCESDVPPSVACTLYVAPIACAVCVWTVACLVQHVCYAPCVLCTREVAFALCVASVACGCVYVEGQ